MTTGFQDMMQNNPMNLTVVWDRWSHRVCMTGEATSHKMVCNLAELDEFGSKKH